MPLHKPREVLPGHRFDSAPSGYDFGDVMTQPQSSYSPLQVVSVVFAGANPRSNPRLQGSPNQIIIIIIIIIITISKNRYIFINWKRS